MLRHPLSNCLLPIFTTLALSAALSAAISGADRDGLDLFERTIRPTLLDHCIRCHGEAKQQGGLRLDSRDGWMIGGDSGPAIVPGKPEESLLVNAVRYESTELEMPPKGILPEASIKAIQQWIKLGAPDPRRAEAATQARVESPSIDQGRKFWSFQPIGQPQLPPDSGNTWPRNSIDQFVRQRLDEKGLQPADDADPSTLVRRVYFDLIGLPPTPKQIDDFINDSSPHRYPRLIDRLLDAPQFGQRWGRHWLDVVRFAQSSGGGRTLLFPDAWRYRDYVIDCFNNDVPYDQFLREQIAGDLLEADDWQDRRRQLIATAFLLLGPTNYEMQDKDILEMDVVDEQLDTIGKSMLGMTIGCARCHDHKFDPIPTHDYYAMAGILKSTKAMIHSNVSQWNTAELPLPPGEEAAVKAHELKLAQAESELKQATQAWLDAGGKPGKANNPSAAKSTLEQERRHEIERLRLKATVDRLSKKVKSLRASTPPRPVAMATTDDEDAGDIHLAIRGVVHNPGPLVPRGVLQVASTAPVAKIPAGQSGRRELALWIADSQNPLTARVMVNRVWHWLIGRGLVPTVDNFGTMGEPPSHLELLDHLASSFIDDGWSVKSLIRRIMLSRTYRMDSRGDTAAARIDPDNRLLWRMNRKRMRAEDIRDAMLLISGDLDSACGGPNVAEGTKSEYDYQFRSKRRSVYVPVFRNTLPQIFEVFDFADPNIQRGRRTSSTIASQALLLMNHPVVIERSRGAAQRLLRDDAADCLSRVEFAFRQVLGRKPTPDETTIAIDFIVLGSDDTSESERSDDTSESERSDDTSESERSDNTSESERWALLYQMLFQSIDFRYLN